MNLIMKKTLKIMLLAILSIAFVSLVACGDNGGQNNNGGGENPKPEVSYTITNTSKIDAKEVSQLYVRDMLSSVLRPIKELKGYGFAYV